jgi:hypothetical protein
MGSAATTKEEAAVIGEMAAVLAQGIIDQYWPFWIALVIVAIIATLGFAFGGRR